MDQEEYKVRLRADYLKRQFESIPFWRMEINDIETMISDIDDMMCSLRSPSFDSPVIENHSLTDSRLNLIDRKTKLEKKAKKYRKNIEYCKELIDSIEDELDHNMIHDYYWLGCSKKVLSERYNYAERSLYYKLDSIIKRLVE